MLSLEWKYELMRLVFIGLSGIGKSHWARALAKELGYQSISIDDKIEERLKQELDLEGSGTRALASWMGMPYSEGYSKREARYLELEEAALKEELTKPLSEFSENCILDTTGSVIYLSDSVLQRLKSFGTVVHFAASDKRRERMFQVFLEDPKPVVWQNSFRKEDGETEQTALERCYKDLLLFRKNRYEELAEVSLPFGKLREPELRGNDFLKLIERASS